MLRSSRLTKLRLPGPNPAEAGHRQTDEPFDFNRTADIAFSEKEYREISLVCQGKKPGWGRATISNYFYIENEVKT
jgi:hypothetical protein